MKNRILTVVCVLSGLLFAFSGYKLIDILTTQNKNARAFDALAQAVSEAQNAFDTPTEAPSEDNADTPFDDGILPEYAGLYAQNNDLYGWISIEGTRINYPVMHTPEAPEYYLSRAFDKSGAVCGTPFLDGDCRDGGGIYIVYAHRMNDGSMFGSLSAYKDKAYWEQHKTIRFDTLYEHGEYEVMAAFFSRIYAPENKGFRYYAYKDLTSRVTFNTYVEQVWQSALYYTGVSAAYGDTLLVLSTCSHHTNDGRFVVVARKK